MPLTSQGREAALRGLRERRERAGKEKRVRNQDLPAGSPMFFECLACGLQNIVVPEGYISKPSLCGECGAMKELGWLE